MPGFGDYGSLITWKIEGQKWVYWIDDFGCCKNLLNVMYWQHSAEYAVRWMIFWVHMGYERMHLMGYCNFLCWTSLEWVILMICGLKGIGKTFRAWHKRLIALVFVQILTLFQCFHTGVPWWKLIELLFAFRAINFSGYHRCLIGSSAKCVNFKLLIWKIQNLKFLAVRTLKAYIQN